MRIVVMLASVYHNTLHGTDERGDACMRYAVKREVCNGVCLAIGKS